MDRQQLVEIIADQKTFPSSSSMVSRKLLTELQDYQASGLINIISGIRRCGKSTLLQELRATANQADYYFNFDDDRLVHFNIDDFQQLYELFIELYGEQNTFYFDEIQNISGWERFVRRLHDYGKKIFIAGSNAKMLSKELGTHLTGRYILSELYPFSFEEYLLLQKADFDAQSRQTTVGKSLLKKHFNDYFQQGGFPEFLKENNSHYLKSLYESILYRDIITRYHIVNEKALKEVAYYAASNIGKEVSFNAIKNMVGIKSATSIKDYFNYLEECYLLFLVPQFDFSLKRQHYTNKKVYLIDLALAKYLGFRMTQDQGRMLENLVFLELKRRGLEIYFHKHLHECDFIIKEGASITQAFQVTVQMSDPQTKIREINGLVESLAVYNLAEGYILTEDEEYTETVKANGKSFLVKVMPVWKWLLTE